MIDKPQRILDRLGAVAAIRARPLDQHDGKAEDARGDATHGKIVAGILADDDIDVMVPQQRYLRLDGEWAARQEVFYIGHIQRRIDGIDAAHKIMVLRRRVEGLRLLPADGEEDAARLRTQRRHRLADRADPHPAVPLRLVPAEPLQPQQGNAGRVARRTGIGGNLPCERMRCIDKEIDGLFSEIGGKSCHAAETAAAHWHRLRRRIERAAGERQRNGKIGPAGEAGRKFARLGRAAQYEDASLVHA